MVTFQGPSWSLKPADAVCAWATPRDGGGGGAVGRGGEPDLTPNGGDSGPQHRDSVSAFSHWLLFPPHPFPHPLPISPQCWELPGSPLGQDGWDGPGRHPLGIADPTFSSHCFGPTSGTTGTSSDLYRGSPQE